MTWPWPPSTRLRPAALVARYATRWEIEQAFGDARNVLGAGEARNRVQRAVERTIPFAVHASTIVVLWHARYGHDPVDIDQRRQDQPGYTAKTEPAFAGHVRQVPPCPNALRSSAHPRVNPHCHRSRRISAKIQQLSRYLSK